MFTLFIDTHDENIILAIFKDNNLLDKYEKEAPNKHSNIVLPMLKEMLDRNSINIHDMKEVLVVNGPGSFTGVRIGVTIAKTLGYTMNIPVKTITSLEMYAISNKTNSNKLVLIHDFKGAFGALFNKDSKIIDKPFYMNNSLLNEYIENNNYKNIIVENKIDLDEIFKYSKNIKPTNAHAVNPIYIKEIEALSHDNTSIPPRFE